MAHSMSEPRKRPTRQHVIADLSVHHGEGFILEEGYTAQRFGSEYSYDLIMTTFTSEGYAEPGSIYFQLKASDSWRSFGAEFAFDVDIRDYNLWIHEEMPVILVLFDASSKKAYWLYVQRYFDENAARRPKKGAKTVRVRVPKKQVVNRLSVRRMRDLKWNMQRPSLGVVT